MDEEILHSNPMTRVRLPKLEQKILPAFTVREIQQLHSVILGDSVRALRNRCLIDLLLDSGIRLKECASIKVGDIDERTGTFLVFGKGQKERMCHIGALALRAYLKYLRVRKGEKGDPLWIGERGPMTHLGIAETLEKLGKAAGVHCHPHKFRRTCALFMLRNGADIFSVQHLLGHSDLDVMKRYLAQENADIEHAHRRFSPLDNLSRMGLKGKEHG